ncbi:hypothetical protein [Paenibacillus sp. AN1007]|uniref:Uncharacterized protein n=1 Tax=Paenibacillus sp. AN1007 TaxID=3151385 RepID=A0AAU8N8S5_9BACL
MDSLIELILEPVFDRFVLRIKQMEPVNEIGGLKKLIKKFSDYFKRA